MVETETKEFIAPSGDKYSIRRLTYREKKIIQSKAIKVQAVMGEDKKVHTTSTLDSPIIALESAKRCIVEAPWLQQGKMVQEDDLDNIKSEDGDALDKAIDEFNYPRAEVEEK